MLTISCHIYEFFASNCMSYFQRIIFFQDKLLKKAYSDVMSIVILPHIGHFCDYGAKRIINIRTYIVVALGHLVECHLIEGTFARLGIWSKNVRPFYSMPFSRMYNWPNW